MDNKKTTEVTGTPQQPKQPNKLNASERINALERLVLSQGQVMDNKFDVVADELDGIKVLLEKLSKRLNATVTAGENGDLNNDSINKILLQEEIKDLEKRVDFLKENGVLKLSETGEIHDRTFIVGRELNQEGTVTTPRVQFSLPSLPADLKALLAGKKLGDVVTPEDRDVSFEIMEVYDITEPPKVDKKFEAKDGDTAETQALSSNKTTKKKTTKKKTTKKKTAKKAK